MLVTFIQRKAYINPITLLLSKSLEGGILKLFLRLILLRQTQLAAKFSIWKRTYVRKRIKLLSKCICQEERIPRTVTYLALKKFLKTVKYSKDLNNFQKKKNIKNLE